VTAITREGSTTELPSGVKVARVNYDDEASLVSALKEQQFLVITLAATGPPDTHSKLVAAAAKAGVPYVMPNNYGADIGNRELCEENLHGLSCLARCDEIEKTGVSSYISMVCVSIGGDSISYFKLSHDFLPRQCSILSQNSLNPAVADIPRGSGMNGVLDSVSHAMGLTSRARKLRSSMMGRQGLIRLRGSSVGSLLLGSSA
jgi:hypothetical protein